MKVLRLMSVKSSIECWPLSKALRSCFKTYLTDLNSSNIKIEHDIYCLLEQFLDNLTFT